MTKATFVALFEATTFDGPDFEIIAKPLKIEFFRGSRDFHVVGQFTRVVTAPRSGQLMLGGNMLIRTAPDKHHLAIFARVDPKASPDEAMAVADELIDEAVCKLATTEGDNLLRNQIYRGPLITGGPFIFPFEVSVAESMIALEKQRVEARLAEVQVHLSRSPALEERLRIASRFYARSLLLPSGVERFILQWTVLEVFPMAGTSHIQPLREWIAQRTGKSLSIIEQKLNVGRIYGYRCDLVHDGRFVSGQARIKLEEILFHLAAEAIASLCGRTYTGALERFFV